MKICFEELTSFFQTYKSEFILGLCALFLAYVIATARKGARKNFPPRLMGLPLVGYLPFLSKNVHLDMMELGKKYGDIFSLKLGSQRIIMLNGTEAIIEALHKSELLGRATNSGLQKAFPSSTFFGSNFHLWKKQRRHVIKFMQCLGLGKTKIEENVMVEIKNFMEILRNSETQPIDVGKPLTSSLSNNLSSMIVGRRFEYDDPKRQFLDKNLEQFFKNFNQICLDALFPWISYIPFASRFLSFQKSRDAIKNYKKYFLAEINEHSKTLNPAYATDFIDLYLIEIDKQKKKNSDTSFNKNMLVNNITDILIAGSESVTSALLWIICIVATFPDIQKKVQKEIMEVIDPDMTPEYMDMRNMPYTRAVIMETLRWRTLSPLSTMHYALKDTTVGGYDILKNESVIFNLWAIHYDPKYWDEPQKFKPERFLSKNGKTVVKPRNFIPFLAGGRACPGESMAYLELFLYTTSILRAFDIVFPGEAKATLKAVCERIISRPEPYFVRFIPKN